MELKHLADVELNEEESAEFKRMQEQADRDAVEDRTSRTIAIRWGNPQLRMIRKAAALRGIPYQVYIKNAAWEVAKRDLERGPSFAVLAARHYSTGAVTVKKIEPGDVRAPFTIGANISRDDWLSRLRAFEAEGWIVDSDAFKTPSQDIDREWVFRRATVAEAAL